MNFISAAFLQINSRIQVVIPTHENAKILFCQRATVSRPIIFTRFLHSRRAKRRGVAQSAILGYGYRYRYWCHLCWPRANPGSGGAFLLTIQFNTPADWLLIIGVASRTRITINFVYCVVCDRYLPRFSRRSIVDQPRMPSHKSNTSRS